MNERIKELEKQAWDYVDQIWDWTNPDNPSKETLFKTKFAELIIKECCQFNYDFLESYREACEVNSKIREHFGVEE